jgi:hypothetical protein
MLAPPLRTLSVLIRVTTHASMLSGESSKPVDSENSCSDDDMMSQAMARGWDVCVSMYPNVRSASH